MTLTASRLLMGVRMRIRLPGASIIIFTTVIFIAVCARSWWLQRASYREKPSYLIYRVILKIWYTPPTALYFVCTISKQRSKRVGQVAAVSTCLLYVVKEALGKVGTFVSSRQRFYRQIARYTLSDRYTDIKHFGIRVQKSNATWACRVQVLRRSLHTYGLW